MPKRKPKKTKQIEWKPAKNPLEIRMTQSN